MKKIINNKDFLLAQPLRTKKQYTVGKIIVFFTGVLCIAIFLLTLLYWNSLVWYYKVALAFLILFMSPDIDDIKFVVKSYDSYYEKWIKHNSSKRSN